MILSLMAYSLTVFNLSGSEPLGIARAHLTDLGVELEQRRKDKESAAVLHYVLFSTLIPSH